MVMPEFLITNTRLMATENDELLVTIALMGNIKTGWETSKPDGQLQT
jgi:hypothetical protein